MCQLLVANTWPKFIVAQRSDVLYIRKVFSIFNLIWKFYLRAGGVAQSLGCLPSMHEDPQPHTKQHYWCQHSGGRGGRIRNSRLSLATKWLLGHPANKCVCGAGSEMARCKGEYCRALWPEFDFQTHIVEENKRESCPLLTMQTYAHTSMWNMYVKR